MNQNIRIETFFSKFIILWGSFLLFISTLALLKLKSDELYSITAVLPIIQAVVILISGYLLKKRKKIAIILFVVIFVLGLVSMIRFSLNGLYGVGLVQVVVYGYLSLYGYINRNTFI